MIALCNTCVGFADDCIAEGCMQLLVTYLSIVETIINSLATIITG